MRNIHCLRVRRNTGKLPMSLRPSAVTSSLANTVPSPGHQLTGPSAKYASRWPSTTRLLLCRRQVRPRPVVGGRPLAAHQLVDQLGNRSGSAGVGVVPGFEDLGEDPLGPAIVPRIGGGDAAAGIMGQTQPAELATAVGDVGFGGGPRMLPLLHRVLFGRQAERIEAQAVQDIRSGHPVVAAVDVGADVTERVPDVQPIPDG